MEQRPFGSSGLTVSALGLGAGQLGEAQLREEDVAALLHGALDLGITLIDTAPSYGLSEERIGRHLGARRRQFVLSTKCGYGVPGVEDWTPECIRRGIDAALGRLRTDWLDVVHFHSCPRETIERAGVLDALLDAVKAGKVRVAAYSGEGDALACALATRRFGSIQTSVNLCDQRGIDTHVAAAAEQKCGVIAKRPLANAPWRFAERPVGHYAEEYWHRLNQMKLSPRELDFSELALRFAASVPGVSSLIVGTRDLAHLKSNVARLARGPLDPEEYLRWRKAFQQHDQGWTGQV